MKVSVIVVAAGSGRRFGYERNKLFYPLCGKIVLEHTLTNLFAAKYVSETVIVVSERDQLIKRRRITRRMNDGL